MPRAAILCLIGLLASAYVAVVVAQDNATQENTPQQDVAQDQGAQKDRREAGAEPGNPPTGRLLKEVEDLKQSVAQQDKRIAELEKNVKLLQAALIPVPKPLPPNTPQWTSPSSWNQIKAGMAEAQVVAILGAPTSVQSVTDSRTLFYQSDPRSASNLAGTVTLMDDRVIAMSPPAF